MQQHAMTIGYGDAPSKVGEVLRLDASMRTMDSVRTVNLARPSTTLRDGSARSTVEAAEGEADTATNTINTDTIANTAFGLMCFP
jgi:hypothetical protein